MNNISKAWNWKKADSKFFISPCEESYYLINRWKYKGYSDFLDLGSGKGRHSIQFAKEGFNVSAIDLSEEGINILRDWATEENLTVNAKVSDMLKLPFSDDRFDCLLSYNVISHTDTNGLKTVISEIGRVLKDGGEFFVTVCSKNDRKFKDKRFPRIDENTTLMIEDGPEFNIPHCCVDEVLIRELFWEFELLTIRQVQDFYVIDGTQHDSWHYIIIGQK
ncbi:class I SAM-dependent methyltransferase [Brassicibacter mesophilus]|uniref:class I SAM-dependent methyltransferase n=1 Tax=Brassicibacter mesophilus TaxID=745119 RepID=UPI003D2296C9